MSIRLLSVDLDVLPTALLPQVKAQARIDHADDDISLKDMIKRIIGLFQNRSEITLNPSTYEWRPNSWEFVNGRAQSPVNPVNFINGAECAGTSSSDPVAYSDSVHGTPIFYFQGTWVSGQILVIDTGYAPEDLPPAIADLIIRRSATAYEYRELLTPNNLELMPRSWEDDAGPLWVPRA